ncbi:MULTISPECIES: TIGR04338 family metallohydrolase [unclassified Mycolicibacterium]|uniref:TIGR04338 family metallohydrolase n=1 Tax=unclassified Mycolicibacterium TaxID=2636767 RepID=UPI001307E681|nr:MULTISPECIES: TIGR04338 family metallohydrolase [unclassified Mycolicibacterium]MUL82749.1 TIGR04338 family metallohydrolase [Mycolicibacterium sp. CBMA 329]MUL89084.1 TIGR04338 family metallohydrolase [Mycolicibacterium sp. CBMA 331]MUL97651.1 TIGR04338 family metallohydrolase [Mycolicibacterium sp. CBMA 334]MUM28675.1 TIGR04338 family metallohydrolase [Mycolicibacterium sp. CBMA 295]MUM38600.1 TIGR04338 family metallohydrolase [Mycolicibacterium sp. CBMA 247]
MSAKDTQRARVYAAEQFVRTMFDRAAQHSSRAIDFFGTSLTLPPEAKFGSVESVQRYVDDVAARVGAQPVAVRRRRGATAAHYELVDGKAVIAVPERDIWALRELVVLHELAHHVAREDPPHGPGFVAAYCELCETIMGPEVGLVLRMVYAKEGVV